MPPMAMETHISSNPHVPAWISRSGSRGIYGGSPGTKMGAGSWWHCWSRRGVLWLFMENQQVFFARRAKRNTTSCSKMMQIDANWFTVSLRFLDSTFGFCMFLHLRSLGDFSGSDTDEMPLLSPDRLMWWDYWTSESWWQPPTAGAASNRWVFGVSAFKGAHMAASLLFQWSKLKWWFQMMAFQLGNSEANTPRGAIFETFSRTSMGKWSETFPIVDASVPETRAPQIPMDYHQSSYWNGNVSFIVIGQSQQSPFTSRTGLLGGWAATVARKVSVDFPYSSEMWEGRTTRVLHAVLKTLMFIYLSYLVMSFCHDLPIIQAIREPWE